MSKFVELQIKACSLRNAIRALAWDESKRKRGKTSDKSRGGSFSPGASSIEIASLKAALWQTWQDIGSEIVGNVGGNREALEVTIDRAFDSLTPEQRDTIKRVGIKNLTKHVKLL